MIAITNEITAGEGAMTRELFLQAIVKFISGVGLVGLLIFLFLSMPLILGSAFSFVIFLVYPVLIAKRIRNEEKVLEDGLEGYKEYKKRVKYRLIPFVW